MQRAKLGPPGLLAVLLALTVPCGCSEERTSAGDRQGGAPNVAFPVEVETAAVSEVEYSVSAVGSVAAFETVQLVARVPGTVEKVSFAEGDRVGATQVLVEIEPERYRIEVDSARAALLRAQAEAAEAEAGLTRREALPRLFPEEDVESYRTRVQVADAVVLERKAALARAELNLEGAHVHAIAAGRIETRTVQTGQYVQAGTVLATLVRREPLLLRFEVPEPDAASLEPGMAATFHVAGDAREYASEIVHVAGAADSTSRMVAITGHVTDAERDALRPGAFAEIRVSVGRSHGLPVIPRTAIRPSERGFLAFVVEDGVARQRLLSLGLRTADGRVEVLDGLRPQELLVVRGAEALEDGSAVRIDAGAETGR